MELITDKRLRPKIYGDERSPNPVMALTYNGKTLWTKPVFGEYEPVWGDTCQVCVHSGRLALDLVACAFPRHEKWQQGIRRARAPRRILNGLQ
jgi:hypothetical protein